MTDDLYFWIEFENDDMGPFVSRELAEMAAGLMIGPERWQEDAQIFQSGLNGYTPIYALLGPMYQNSQCEWWGIDYGDFKLRSRRAARAAEKALAAA